MGTQPRISDPLPTVLCPGVQPTSPSPQSLQDGDALKGDNTGTCVSDATLGSGGGDEILNSLHGGLNQGHYITSEPLKFIILGNKMGPT